MVKIVPTVLATDPQEFGTLLERVQHFAPRIHIDIADGEFAPNTTINLAQAYWDEKIEVDLHLMINKPGMRTELCISLKPSLVIIHAEASDHGYSSKEEMIQQLKDVGIRTGLALLPHTAVQTVEEQIKLVEHVMIFAGKLGHYGGSMDKDVLQKIAQVKAINQGAEVGIDGGVNDTNAADAIAAGAEVLNVGGFIQKAEDPQKAYDKLVQIAQKVG